MSSSSLSAPSLLDSLFNLEQGSGAFYLALALGIVALVLVVLMILRARKPLQLPPLQSAPGALARLRRAVAAAPENRWNFLFGRAMKAMRFLSTRREWRYGAPWVLMLGEKGAGKSSIAASLESGRRTTLLLREKQLSLEGTDWHFYNQGVLIDPLGNLPAAGVDSGEGKAWRLILDALEAHRPERPLDAIVLTVSAATLLESDYDSRQQLAEQCYEQLFTLQKRFEFSYPVYVVLSKCDSIKGFSAFWQAQGSARNWQRAMWGWSNVTLLEEREMADCVANAWDQLGDDLRRLQIEAAVSESVKDSDGFFLFPDYFAALQEPLASFLDVVFRPSVYHASFYLRGIYCTGSAQGNGLEKEGIQTDIACVDDLFEARVFQEKNLARPVRESIWSRNRLLRRLQVVMIGIFAALALTLAGASYELDHKTQALASALVTIKSNAEGGNLCHDKATVFKLLDEISAADMNLRYWLIPASWFDARITQSSAKEISESAFKTVIMPSIQCHLERRAKTLLSGPPPQAAVGPMGAMEASAQARNALLSYVAEAAAFEQQRKVFESLSRVTAPDRGQEQLAAFDSLLHYIYGEGLPVKDQDDEATYAQALLHMEYPHRLVLERESADFREAVSDHIGVMAEQLFKTTLRALSEGEDLVRGVRESKAPVLATLNEFDSWIAWASKNWLASSQEQNPCSNFNQAISPNLRVLNNFDYPAKLQKLINRFIPANCYEQAMAKLLKLELPPYGNLFVKLGDIYVVATPIQMELQGMRQLQSQDFMQLLPRESFECRADAAGWRPQALDEASRYVRDYQNFARLQGADALAAAGQRPLYDQLARKQLQMVLDQVITQGQIPAPAASMLGQTRAGVLSLGDQELAQRSGDFAKVVDPLIRMLDLYRQLGFSDSANRITQCARTFSSHMLLRADSLAEASRLYQPQGEQDDNGPLYTLGGPVETKDYLSRQLQRGQVLGNYAAPFVAFLKNGEAVDDSKQANNQSLAYWDNTLSELQRYVQFKEPNGQVAHLENFFLKQLIELSFDNCGRTLAAYQAEALGNDFFSERRQILQKDADWRCDNRIEADVYAQYQGLATRFNRELAGSFPFGPLSAADASPVLVKNFFAYYDEQRAALLEAMGNLGKRRDPQWQMVQRFIEQLDRASVFFRSSLTGADGPQPLRLDIGFRAQPRLSPGSEQIVAWRLSSGAKLASYPNGANSLDWMLGEMLLLELEWANQSRFRPVADPQQNDMRVDGSVAAFAGMGDWALLRFVTKHRSRMEESSLDGNRLGIELNIPVSSQKVGPATGAMGAARAYMTLTLAGIDPKTQAFTPVRLPVFPQKAPLIH